MKSQAIRLFVGAATGLLSIHTVAYAINSKGSMSDAAIMVLFGIAAILVGQSCNLLGISGMHSEQASGR